MTSPMTNIDPAVADYYEHAPGDGFIVNDALIKRAKVIRRAFELFQDDAQTTPP